MAFLTIQCLEKLFDRHHGRGSGLHRIDLDVERGEFISLLGPSGCGKTTTLRCIAGLETPDQGRVELDGKVLFSSDRSSGRPPMNVAPERRGISMVFQDYALWPHMDVSKNVAFGLKGSGLTRAEISAEVQQALRSVRLWDHRDKRVSQLSGGQQQRVALARALAPTPKIVLFDEPLSNLDSQLREDMRLEIRDLQQRMGLTAIWVTHDQEEALGLSTRVVLMNEGRVEQIGRPVDLWTEPSSPFVASFLGTTTRISGEVVATEAGLALSIPQARPIPLPDGSLLRPGDRASIFVRPGAIALYDHSLSRQDTWKVRLLGQMFHGEHTMITVSFGGVHLRIRSDRFLDPQPEFLDIQVDSSRLMAFRDE